MADGVNVRKGEEPMMTGKEPTEPGTRSSLSRQWTSTAQRAQASRHTSAGMMATTASGTSQLEHQGPTPR